MKYKYTAISIISFLITIYSWAYFLHGKTPDDWYFMPTLFMFLFATASLILVSIYNLVQGK